MNGFERRREKKMENIIASACELFSAKGIKSVSIADIAKKANVSQVSIYNFFESKENLIKLALFRIMDLTMNDLEVLVKSDLSFYEKFNQMVSISFDAGNNIDENVYQSKFFKDPSVHKYLEEYQLKVMPLLIGLIEQGKNEGQIDPDISSESIILYINSLNNILQSNINKKTRVDIGKLFFYGLLGKNSERS